MTSWIVTTRSEPAPERCRAREAVNEVDTLLAGPAAGEAAARRAPIRGGCGHSTGTVTEGIVAPRRRGVRRGLAAHERRQAEIGLLAERGDQLAGIGLHPAGFAGDEEHEVQADVH